tara:strand:+ start:108 stop:1061 length:954 start_codon:yes stop_codon:yes gene_type:complete
MLRLRNIGLGIQPDKYPQKAYLAKAKVIEGVADNLKLSSDNIFELKNEAIPSYLLRPNQLAPHLSHRLINSKPKIKTTINYEWQSGVSQIMDNFTNRYPEPVNGAALIVERKTGKVRSYVGSGETMQKYNISKLNSFKHSETDKKKSEPSGSHCPSCGQRLNLISRSDTCPRCNPILGNKPNYTTPTQTKKKKIPEKQKTNELNKRHSVSQQNDDQNIPTLIDNIIWFIMSVGLIIVIWTISMSIMIFLSSNADATGGTIICGVIFFGTFYLISTLNGFGEPPSQYHYQHAFELAFGLVMVCFGPALGAIVVGTLFW